MSEINLLNKSDSLVLESSSPRYIKNVKELRVYREAFDISIEVHKETLNFPKIEQLVLVQKCRYGRNAPKLGYIDSKKAEKWIDKYDYISRMLQKLRINIESSNPRVLESTERTK